MKYERPYKAGGTIKPGYAVTPGADENTIVTADNDDDFLGVYEFENQRADRVAGDNLGVVIGGPAKVSAGGNVTNGKKAVVDTDGQFINCPATPGRYATVGTFLESGILDEYVDLFVERGSVTITT